MEVVIDQKGEETVIKIKGRLEMKERQRDMRQVNIEKE